MRPLQPVEPVAVVGMACRVPGAADARALWRNVVGGVESITRFDEQALVDRGLDPEMVRRPDYVKAAGVLDDADAMDAAFFGLTPRDAETMDPQHRLFLELAWHALEDAGFPFEAGRAPVGVFGGVGPVAYLWTNVAPTLGPLGLLDPLQARLANDKDFVTSWVSYKLGLTGPSVAVQTACSTSLTAVHLACESLRAGECELALAGGAYVGLPLAAGYLAPEGGPASSDGRCRPFDRDARGFVPGSGGGMVALKRLEDAQRDGDHVYAVVLGSAVGNDGGMAAGFTAPGVDGQAAVITEALQRAGVAPETIGYLEAHGTGTALGDPIEIEALQEAFGATGRRCALGAVKANIGHLDAAAGVVGFIKAVLVLYHGEIPPLANFAEPNPLVDFERSPFEVPRQPRAWAADSTPRRAGVSSFGMGGTNAHAVLQEPPPVARLAPPPKPRLFPLSARTEVALDASTDRLAEHLTGPGLSPLDAAWTLQVGRRHFACRRYVVARSAEEAVDHLRDRSYVSPRTVSAPERPPAVAFLFPGQGAQREGMAGRLGDAAPVFSEVLSECAERLRPHLGWDVRSVVCEGDAGFGPPPADLTVADTAVAQPALFAVEYALARQWEAWGVAADCVIGHSVGEYVAACVAGVFALDDALALVAERGRLMQACSPGAMVALRASPAAAAELAHGVGGAGLEVAAVNGPTDCVVAGVRADVERLAHAAEAAGVPATVLRTSHAFHSRLVEPMVEPLRQLVASVPRHPPAVPVLSNRTGTWLTDAEATDPAYWAAHTRHPVRFGDNVAELLALDHDAVVVEVGPPALSGLVRKHPSFRPTQAVLPSLPPPGPDADPYGRLLESLGRLWLRGASVAWDELSGPESPRRVPLPAYPFERKRYWLGTTLPTFDAAEVPAPEADGAALRPGANATEEAMLTVWRDVFGDPDIGVHDSFFDIGGDSLRAIHLLNRVSNVLGVTLSVEVLFDADTVAALAAAAEQALRGDAEPRIVTVSLSSADPAPIGQGAQG